MMISPLLFRITSLRNRSIISSRNFTDGLSAFYKERFVLTSEVKRCLQNKNPVVALESTIITHGMPFPQNLRTIQSVEKIIRENDATPAIIAVLNGKIHIGLEDNDLQNLAAKEFPVTKVSRRDLPVILAKKMNGGTTVSATMLIAHRIGIPVFVTGGIGGVHRGAEFSFDISADLTELGRTPITVISSGVKSILDINKTLEYLETQGVTVVSFGNSKEFPSFFTSKSGFFSPYNVKTPIQAAEIMAASNDMKLENGILIAVPIPEKDSANGKLVEDAILQSLEKSKQENINGKDVTPYILQQVNELTKGKSLEANIALIENNAKIGSQIAVEYAKLRNLQKNSTFPSNVHSIRKEENDEIQTHNQPSISST